MYKLPLKTTGFEQLNLGDQLGLGDLWQSFNLNTSDILGTLQVSPRMLLNINTDDDAQLTAPPCAFRVFISGLGVDIWAIAGAVLWKTTDGGPNDTFVQDGTANTPTDCSSDYSDLCVANSIMFVTQASTTVKTLSSGGVWGSATGTLANSAGLHQMTFFRAQNRTYVVDDNGAGISSLSGSTITAVAASTQYTLNDLVEGAGVNVGSEISCITSNSTRIGIGTINKTGLPTCRFYTWDGSSGGGGTYGPNEEYIVNASGVLATLVVDDTFVIFTTKGELQQLNGGTFVTIAKLPLELASLKLPLATATDRPVHYNGMSIKDGNIEILINTQLWDTNSTVKERCPSGVWCYDRTTKNFYHKRSFGLTKAGGTIVDYGASKLSKVGALSEVEVISATPTQGSIVGGLVAGVQYSTAVGTTKNGIFYDDSADTLQKAGILTTLKIPSGGITDIFKFVYAMLGRKFLSSLDKIVIKARTEEDEPTEATITYTSTTTFTTPTASFATAPVVGDEVEIILGVGSGRTAHITEITTSAPNYVITVDETITGATTQTARARFQSWKKVGSYSEQSRNWFKIPMDTSIFGASSWAQIRLWILWTGKNKLNSLIISSDVSEKIE